MLLSTCEAGRDRPWRNGPHPIGYAQAKLIHGIAYTALPLEPLLPKHFTSNSQLKTLYVGMVQNYISQNEWFRTEKTSHL